jgi:hypothetical protein
MSRKFDVEKFTNLAATISASDTVLIGPVDMRGYETFSMMFQNNNTSIAFLNLQVQAAYDVSGTAADKPPNWVQINSADLIQNSALGATASVMTSSVFSTRPWIRIIGRTASPGAAGILTVHIAGHRKT